MLCSKILSFHLKSITESMSVFQLRVDVGNKTGDESLAISRFRFIIANKMALMVLACGYGRIHSTKKTFQNIQCHTYRTQKQKKNTLNVEICVHIWQRNDSAYNWHGTYCKLLMLYHLLRLNFFRADCWWSFCGRRKEINKLCGL